MVGKFPVPFTRFFRPFSDFSGYTENETENWMCYYENGTVNDDTYLPSVFGILGKIRYFPVFFGPKKTKEARTIPVRV
jgi:hypothetical protein